MSLRPLPLDAEVRRLTLISTEQMAELYGISTHALHMRLRRPNSDVPEPHFRMGRCLIWVLTVELAEQVGVRDR